MLVDRRALGWERTPEKSPYERIYGGHSYDIGDHCKDRDRPVDL